MNVDFGVFEGRDVKRVVPWVIWYIWLLGMLSDKAKNEFFTSVCSNV